MSSGGGLPGTAPGYAEVRTVEEAVGLLEEYGAAWARVFLECRNALVWDGSGRINHSFTPFFRSPASLASSLLPPAIALERRLGVGPSAARSERDRMNILIGELPEDGWPDPEEWRLRNV